MMVTQEMIEMENSRQPNIIRNESSDYERVEDTPKPKQSKHAHTSSKRHQ